MASSTRIVHRYACELRPAVLEDIGLIPALEGALQAFQSRTGIQPEFESFPEVEKLSLSRRTTLFRGAQEALSNTLRHAQASELKVVLNRQGKMVVMEIAGGRLEIKASPGKGTRIIAIIPSKDAAA